MEFDDFGRKRRVLAMKLFHWVRNEGMKGRMKVYIYIYMVEATEGSIRTDRVRNIGKKHRFFSVLCYRFIRDRNKTWRWSDVKDRRAKGTMEEERRKF